VSIDKEQRIYIGQKPIELSLLDTLIRAEVLKAKASIDTPSVVINADTIAYYGEVFRIMQAAKRAGAKVVANVK